MQEIGERYGIIYCIMNKTNKKKYIGQTTQSIQKRWNSHVYLAQSGANIKLSCALRKYGITNFVIKEIERVILSELDECEKKWIAIADTFSNGYNMTLGGEGGCLVSDDDAGTMLSLWGYNWSLMDIANETGYHASTVASTLEQYGVTAEERALRCNTSRAWQAKAITQIDIMSGKIIRVFPSIGQAATAVGSSVSNLLDCCRGNSNSVKSFFWKMSSDISEVDKKGGFYSGELPRRFGSGAEVMYDHNEICDLYIAGNNCIQIAEIVGCCISVVSKTLRAAGFTDIISRSSSYLSTKVVQLGLLDDSIVEYASLKAAARAVSGGHSSVHTAIKEKKLYRGCYWMYKEDYDASCCGVGGAIIDGG